MLREKVESFIKDEKIRAFSETDKSHYIIPYRWKSKNIKLTIYIDIYEQQHLFKISFKSKIKESSSYGMNEIKDTLLDLNSKLLLGTISLQSNSNTLVYSIDYNIEEDKEISEKTYNKYIMYCFTLYDDLITKNIIIANGDSNE